MSDIIPLVFITDQANNAVDFVNDDMKVALLSGTYDDCKLKSLTSYDEIKKYELSPYYGYQTGGFVAPNKSINTVDDMLVYDMGDVGMTVHGGTLGPTRYAVLYDEDVDNHLVYIFDFGEDKTVKDGAQFKIKIDDKGLMGAKQMYECDSTN